MVDQILVDDDSSIENLTPIEKELKAAAAARRAPQKSVEKPAAKVDDEDADLPEKYRGKSRKEIAEMHRNLETSYGRMANDLGTQRQMTDTLLGLKRDRDLQDNSAPTKVEIKGDELLANPTEALERFTEPQKRANEQRLAQIEASLAQQAFLTRHPDYSQYANDPDFGPWVAASAIRQRAAAAAAQGDWNIAGDLLAEYKAEKGRKPAVKDEDELENAENENPLKAARSAALESSSQGNSGARKSAKIYKRAEVMNLRINKPDVYYSEEFQDEIIRAYSEGRVR